MGKFGKKCLASPKNCLLLHLWLTPGCCFATLLNVKQLAYVNRIFVIFLLFCVCWYKSVVFNLFCKIAPLPVVFALSENLLLFWKQFTANEI